MTAMAAQRPIHAQESQEDETGTPVCGLFGTPRFSGVHNIGAPTPEAVRIVKWITDGVGIHQNFDILAGDFALSWGAFATIRNNKRYIVYDRKVFSWGKGKASWRDIHIMGHEIGHHVAAHVAVRQSSSHERELEADRFSGVALSRLGARFDHVQSLFRGNTRGTLTHPAGLKRDAALREGWLHGEKMKARQSLSCNPTWLGDEVNIEGKSCRIAKTCEGRLSYTKLACQNDEGNWHWMD